MIIVRLDITTIQLGKRVSYNLCELFCIFFITCYQQVLYVLCVCVCVERERERESQLVYEGE